MQPKTTAELNEILKNTKPSQVRSYLKKNRPYMADEQKAFYYYMKEVLTDKNIRLKDVYLLANVSESYGSKILTMEKHTTDRDLILRFCFAGHLSLPETNRALKLYGMNELYAKDSRDACLIVALHNRIYDMDRVDELLAENGLKKLTAEAEE